MNYGFNGQCDGWKEDKKTELANEIKKTIIKLNLKPDKGYERYTPYVEVDGMYKGVRIRRITHLSGKDQQNLVKKADKVYKKVMQLN